MRSQKGVEGILLVMNMQIVLAIAKVAVAGFVASRRWCITIGLHVLWSIIGAARAWKCAGKVRGVSELSAKRIVVSQG